ncbi:DUF3046 domain-containing protein [Planctomonas psychrotolerans]|uniref:DUF3046 domain-containing protein n=1 Tax=Planctomonas psychrotolerans TaxID=2528712 RepID=UPI001239532C|nr:DUF3046 domain-containing protein [Planctomonas psychrotolerans]
MRLSEFRNAVADEFGPAYGRVLLQDLVLTDLGSRTAEVALAEGVRVNEVWMALCRATDVPESRRHGVGRPEPRH